MADADVDGLTELVLLPEGAAFGNYIIHECIGQGAMGNVYRAEHALLEKLVAIKVMDSSLLSSSDARERFLREGRAAAAIKHPNVVDITDVGVFEGTPYLVMELLEGEDLQIYLQRKPQLSEREIASLLLPIAAALGAAHDRGVVHRDLKPSNIFLSRGPDGEIVPKILDFGISKIAHALASADFQSTPFNQLMGSPLYLPPEAVRGSRDLSAKSDQYSLGVVLYECVTGQPPFAGDSLLSILNSIADVVGAQLRAHRSVGAGDRRLQPHGALGAAASDDGACPKRGVAATSAQRVARPGGACRHLALELLGDARPRPRAGGGRRARAADGRSVAASCHRLGSRGPRASIGARARRAVGRGRADRAERCAERPPVVARASGTCWRGQGDRGVGAARRDGDGKRGAAAGAAASASDPRR
jgi:tRNA A-37 threonylcarbamoyl transferase component Bud32